jgi:hypothetical protein
MENKIRSYHNHLSYHADKKELASELRDVLMYDLSILQQEMTLSAEICSSISNYFKRREHKYAIELLERFIETGNTDFDGGADTFYFRYDRYKRIKAVINSLFIELPAIQKSYNKAG